MPFPIKEKFYYLVLHPETPHLREWQDVSTTPERGGVLKRQPFFLLNYELRIKYSQQSKNYECKDQYNKCPHLLCFLKSFSFSQIPLYWLHSMIQTFKGKGQNEIIIQEALTQRPLLKLNQPQQLHILRSQFLFFISCCLLLIYWLLLISVLS